MISKDPWMRPAPKGYPVSEIGVCVVEDRLRYIRDVDDLTRLRAMFDWPGTQMTVKKALERRIRKLSKGQIH